VSPVYYFSSIPERAGSELDAAVRSLIRALPALVPAGALASTLVGCAASAPARAEAAELGVLQLGRRCEIGGRRHTLDARFDVVGPVELELDTAPPNDAASWELAAGRYAITIRPNFSVWRDVTVAQVRVTAELAEDARQLFEITSGASTHVAYQLLVEGETANFDQD
jgi:hypothetical protein